MTKDIWKISIRLNCNSDNSENHKNLLGVFVKNVTVTREELDRLSASASSEELLDLVYRALREAFGYLNLDASLVDRGKDFVLARYFKADFYGKKCKHPDSLGTARVRVTQGIEQSEVFLELARRKYRHDILVATDSANEFAFQKYLLSPIHYLPGAIELGLPEGRKINVPIDEVWNR